MRCLISLISCISIFAAFTGIGSKAFLCTGRWGHFFFINMVQRLFVIICSHQAADTTSVCGIALLCTGWFRHFFFVSMALCILIICDLCFSTVFTGIGLVTFLYAGWLCFFYGIIMSVYQIQFCFFSDGLMAEFTYRSYASRYAAGSCYRICDLKYMVFIYTDFQPCLGCFMVRIT